MTTPFYHLSIAWELLNPGRTVQIPQAVRSFLKANRGAFLFGNTAPDVQVLSRQARRATHFFDLPFRHTDPFPWEQMLTDYALLANPQALPPAQAAFLAGYLCHLQADWLWIREIFDPVFGPRAGWETLDHRLYLHNVLRADIDQQVLAGLPANSAACLDKVQPYAWLPFVVDQYLLQWREALVAQLRPGAVSHTVEVFAARQGVAPGAFYDLLSSPERMEREVFQRVTRQQLSVYRNRLLVENSNLLQKYLFIGISSQRPAWVAASPQ